MIHIDNPKIEPATFSVSHDGPIIHIAVDPDEKLELGQLVLFNAHHFIAADYNPTGDDTFAIAIDVEQAQAQVVFVPKGISPIPILEALGEALALALAD